MTLIRVNHQASHELVLLFSRFVQQWIDLFDLWERIKLQGRKKGFSEKELAEMARPYLKQRGMSKDKIYYLFHREEQNERVRRRKITTMTAKSIPLKSSLITKFDKKENVVHFQELLSSSNSGSVILNAKQVDVIEFNLVEALNMGLRNAINMIDTAKGCVCIVKIYVKDGIVIKVGDSINDSMKETFSA